MNDETEVEQKGQQSLITPRIQSTADNLEGEGDDLIKNAVGVYNRLRFVNYPYPDYTRTADEILESKEYRGCQDAGTVLVALLRARGMNVTFIQAFVTKHVEEYQGSQYHGHVFVRLISNENDEEGNPKSRIIDSTRGTITDDLPEGFTMGFEGLDAWDAGLHSEEDYYARFRKAREEVMNKNNQES